MSIGRPSRWQAGSCIVSFAAIFRTRLWRPGLSPHPTKRATGRGSAHKKEGQDLGLPEALRKAKGGLLSASVWVSGQTTLSWGQPLRACRSARALLVAACGDKVVPRAARACVLPSSASLRGPRSRHSRLIAPSSSPGRAKVAKALGGVKFYFCEPHHLWQKPIVKNTDVLICEFFL